ncbi:MAG: inositol monophosphatase [Proteobacteria bacterium]|nr:inositol monophosphatase [Pseudomonadota bacterium]
MHALVNIALRAARDAAEAIAHSSDRLDRVKVIDNRPETFLTSMDQDADKTICYHLAKAYPDYSLHSRVSGFREGKAGGPLWLVDPLIGSRNFASGYTQFAVSIACQTDGVINHAVVVLPLLREEFVATRGTGAQLNSRRIRVSTISDLSEILIGLNAKGLALNKFAQVQRALIESGADIRISGCSPLDMIQTAAGRLQGGWCETPDLPTMAAARLILTEAGGLLGTEAGNPDLSSSEELLFGNPKIFKELIKMRSAAA